MAHQQPGRAGRAAAAAAAAAAAEQQAAGIIVRCPDCRALFCFDCDAFIHEQLHNCPGCECLPPEDGGEDLEEG